MLIEKMFVKVEGVSPLIIHNGRTGNPLDPFTKRLKSLTSKRNKTDEDYEAILELAWEAALYFDDEIGLYMPTENVYAGLLAAAKKHKFGPKVSAISFPVNVGKGFPILTEGHLSFEALKADKENRYIRMVTIQKAKTVSCRPKFDKWKIDFEFEFDPTMFDPNELKTMIYTMTTRIGFGVWRPNSPKPGTFGKFKVNEIVWETSKGEKRVLDGEKSVF